LHTHTLMLTPNYILSFTKRGPHWSRLEKGNSWSV